MNSSLNQLKSVKRSLNEVYNSVKAKYNRGNRSEATRRHAASYSSLKKRTRNLFGYNYSRHRNVTDADVMRSMAYIRSNAGRAASNAIFARGNNAAAASRLINEELASGSNVFANFTPRSQFDAMRASISPEEMNELHAGLNNNNNNTASTTSTGSFVSAKSKGGRRRTNKNLKRKRITRRK